MTPPNMSLKEEPKLIEPVTLIMDSIAVDNLCTKLGTSNYLDLLPLVAELPTVKKIIIPAYIADLELRGMVVESLGVEKTTPKVIYDGYRNEKTYQGRHWNSLTSFLTKTDRQIIDHTGRSYYIDRKSPKIVIEETLLERETLTRMSKARFGSYSNHAQCWEELNKIKAEFRAGEMDIGEFMAHEHARLNPNSIVITDDFKYALEQRRQTPEHIAEYGITSSVNLIAAIIKAYGEHPLKKELETRFGNNVNNLSPHRYIEENAKLRQGLMFLPQELYSNGQNPISNTLANQKLYQAIDVGVNNPERIAIPEPVLEPKVEAPILIAQEVSPPLVSIQVSSSTEIMQSNDSTTEVKTQSVDPLEEAVEKSETEIDSEESRKKTPKVIAISKEQMVAHNQRKTEQDEKQKPAPEINTPAKERPLKIVSRDPLPKAPEPVEPLPIENINIIPPSPVASAHIGSTAPEEPKVDTQTPTQLDTIPAAMQVDKNAAKETVMENVMQKIVISTQETFGYKLGVHRVERNLTEAQVAENVRGILTNQSDVTAETVYHWQQGRAVPNSNELEALVKILITDNMAVTDKQAFEKNFRTAHELTKRCIENGTRDPDQFAFSDVLFKYRNELGLSEQLLAEQLTLKTHIPVTEDPDSIDARLIYDISAGAHIPSKGLVLALVKAMDTAEELSQEEKAGLFTAFENFQNAHADSFAFRIETPKAVNPVPSAKVKAPAAPKLVKKADGVVFNEKHAFSARKRMIKVFEEILPDYQINQVSKDVKELKDVTLPPEDVSLFIGKNAMRLPVQMGEKKLAEVKAGFMAVIRTNGGDRNNGQNFSRAFDAFTDEVLRRKTEIKEEFQSR